MCFSSKQRPLVSARDPTMQHQQISKVLGQRWRELTQAERQPYIAMAEEEKRQHAIKYPDYKYKPVKKKDAQQQQQERPEQQQQQEAATKTTNRKRRGSSKKAISEDEAKKLKLKSALANANHPHPAIALRAQREVEHLACLDGSLNLTAGFSLDAVNLERHQSQFQPVRRRQDSASTHRSFYEDDSSRDASDATTATSSSTSSTSSGESLSSEEDTITIRLPSGPHDMGPAMNAQDVDVARQGGLQQQQGHTNGGRVRYQSNVVPSPDSVQ